MEATWGALAPAPGLEELPEEAPLYEAEEMAVQAAEQAVADEARCRRSVRHEGLLLHEEWLCLLLSSAPSIQHLVNHQLPFAHPHLGSFQRTQILASFLSHGLEEGWLW